MATIIPCAPITETENSHIYGSDFVGSGICEEAGAAISLTGDLYLSHCSFIDLASAQPGGAVSLTGSGFFEAHWCCFFGCYTQADLYSNIGGNAMNVDDHDTHMNLITAFKSGPQDLGGDSLWHIRRRAATVKNQNVSNCFGQWGAIAGSYPSNYNDVMVAFLNAIDSIDHDFIEMWKGNMSIKKSNFVGLAVRESTFFARTDAASIQISQCFINVSVRYSLYGSPSRYSFVHCSGELYGVMLTEQFSSHQLQLLDKHCMLNSHMKRVRVRGVFLLLFFIFLESK